MSGQQITFHPIGKKLQTSLAFLACRHALILHFQALGNPLRQLGALYRFNLQGDTKLVQGAKPGAFLGGIVQFWQDEQGQGAVIALCTLRQLLNHGAALFAGLARWNANFQHLSIGKQTQRTTGRQNFAPIEVRTRDHMHTALGVALCTRRGANGIGSLLHQQGFITVQGVQTAQAFLQMRLKLRQGQLHKLKALQINMSHACLHTIKVS